jgi:hypothetical protein
VSRTHVSDRDVARILKGLPLLRVLRGHGCKNIRDFAQVPRGLEVLDLSATSIGDASVAALLAALASPVAATSVVTSTIGVTPAASKANVELGGLDDDEPVKSSSVEEKTKISDSEDPAPASLAVLLLSDCKELKRPVIQSSTLR